MNEYSTLLLERRDGVAVLTMNRPQARNALDLVMREEFPRVIAEIAGDAQVRAVVLTGAGGAFSAGGDVKSMAGAPRDAVAARKRLHDIHEWLPALVNLEKPVVAAVDGPAFGGGFSLALAADFVLATPRATFCQVFARIGLVPDMSALFLLPRIVGLQRAKELMLSARVVDAQEAQRLGIVLELHEPQALLPAAIEMAGRFREASPIAAGLTKNLLNQSFHLDQRAMAELESYAQALCMSSDFHRDAAAAFAAGKRPGLRWEPRR
jgi:2-(1,2-epoxy-1,2-dihydrophenyl)acetyl-CoA isomerase